MSKTLKTVLAVIGALTALAGILLLIKKLTCKCKKCCCEKTEDDQPETVEDFVEEATEKVEKAVDETADKVEEIVEETGEQAEEKADAIAEEFKDYADVELPKE